MPRLHYLCSQLILISLLSAPVMAQVTNPFEWIEPQSRSQLWLNAGMQSYHYDGNNQLNNNNIGFGAEYVFSTVASATLGGYKNSNSKNSNYAGIYYHPIALGPVQFGLVGSLLNGYQKVNHGGYFPALIPAASFEKDWFGVNMLFIPTVGDKIRGVISLQLKLKGLD